MSDGSSVIGEGAAFVAQKCQTCAGSEKYEEGREAVCSMLFTKILGRNCRVIQCQRLPRNKLKSSKASADELGDLLYNLYFNCFRDVSTICTSTASETKFLPTFLELVVAQLGASICPSIDPFHLLYYMGQDSKANTYLLARSSAGGGVFEQEQGFVVCAGGGPCIQRIIARASSARPEGRSIWVRRSNEQPYS
jgi:hypothetical protein